VAADDVVDARNFAIEGTPRADPIVDNKWSHALSDYGTDEDQFGTGDFDRSTDRGDADVTLAEIWPTLQAYGRQIQDMKGPRGSVDGDGDGRMDAYSRPFQPARFAVGGSAQQMKQTKSMRSLETVTFTVGDGTTDFGDFNGLNGFAECMEFIEAQQASLPQHIRIVVKDRRPVGDYPVYTWNGNNVSIADHFIEIIGMGSGFDTVFNPTPYSGFGEGQVFIDLQPLDDDFAIQITGSGGLHVENIRFTEITPVTNNPVLIDVQAPATFSMKNSVISGKLDQETSLALKCPSDGCHIEDSVIIGTCAIGGRQPNFFTDRAEQTAIGGTIRNTIFTECIMRLRSRRTITGVPSELWDFADTLSFERCTFAVGASVLTPLSQGMIDARGARNIKFDQCQIQYSGDEDAVRLGQFDLGAPLHAVSRNIAFDLCSFEMVSASTHTGHVGGAGGVNGTEGTGWAIKCEPNLILGTNPKSLPEGIFIERCAFSVSDAPIGFFNSSPDAGAIQINNARDVHIRKNRVELWTQPSVSAGDIQGLIELRMTSPGVSGSGGSYWVEDNYIGRWRENAVGGAWGGAAGTQFLRCVNVDNVRDSHVNKNTISAFNELGGTIDPGLLPCALHVEDAFGCEFNGNKFVFWRSVFSPFISTAVGFGSSLTNCQFNDNKFETCGGYMILQVLSGPLEGVEFAHNHFKVGNAVAINFVGCISTGSNTGSLSGAGVYVRDNSWDYFGAGGNVSAVLFGPTPTLAVTGNMFPFGIISHGTYGGAPNPQALGYAVPVGNRDLNQVASYT
jgi:hypothetical protein